MQQPEHPLVGQLDHERKIWSHRKKNEWHSDLVKSVLAVMHEAEDLADQGFPEFEGASNRLRSCFEGMRREDHRAKYYCA